MGKNLTTGSVFRTIVTFALPYLLSYFLQTLYGMADLFIAGQFIGIDGITAVANGSQVLYMLTVVIVGLAMGATVTIGRAVGANRLDRAAKAIGNVITLFAGIALALTVVLLLNVHNIISLIGVPVEAVEGTAQYLTICYIASRSSSRTTLSARCSVGWAIRKAPCISLRLHASATSCSTTCLWAGCVLVPRARHWAPHWRRPSV